MIGDDILGQSSGGATAWLLYDGHGSTRALAGADAQGQPLITARYSYDAYGMMLGGDPSLSKPAATDMLYSGEQFDPGLQQQYLRARYYDQKAGVFAAMDRSQRPPSTLGSYRYCNDNPVDLADPDGWAPPAAPASVEQQKEDVEAKLRRIFGEANADIVREIKKIASVYIGAFRRKKAQGNPDNYMPDYKHGFVCYAWVSALEPFLDDLSDRLTKLEIKRVGHFEGPSGELEAGVAHNYFLVVPRGFYPDADGFYAPPGATYTTNGGMLKAAVLDPWLSVRRGEFADDFVVVQPPGPEGKYAWDVIAREVPHNDTQKNVKKSVKRFLRWTPDLTWEFYSPPTPE